MFPQAARIAARSPQGANSPAAGNAIAPADKQLNGYCVRRRRGGGRGWGWEQRLSVSPQKNRFEAAQKQSRTRPRKGCSWNISSVSILGT